MRLLRIILGLLLVAIGGAGATAAGFEMLLSLAYGVWGLAFAFCMGTALASLVLLAGVHVLRGRMPAFMTYTVPMRAPVAPSGPPRAPPPPAMRTED